MIPAETRYGTHDGKLLAIVKAFKTWRHYLKGYQHECSYLPTTTTSIGSWKWRVWASDKFARPRNSLATTSKSTIVRAKVTGLLMPYLDTLNKVQKWKRPFAPRMLKFCTVCSPRWPEYLAFRRAIRVNSLFSIKFSYAERLSILSYAISGTHSKPKWLLKVLTAMSEI